jgi:hypothetical protein
MDQAGVAKFLTQEGCALQLFFIRSKWVKVNMDLIRFILACFGIFAYTIYSHHWFILASNIRTSLHKNIQFNAKQILYMLKGLFPTERIFSHTGKYSLQIFILKRIFAKFRANFTFKWICICLQIFIHKQTFAPYCFKLFRKAFQLIFGTFFENLRFTSLQNLCF